MLQHLLAVFKRYCSVRDQWFLSSFFDQYLLLAEGEAVFSDFFFGNSLFCKDGFVSFFLDLP